MYKTKGLKRTRDTQLMAIAGLVAGFSMMIQLNLQEVLRWDRFQHSILSAMIFLGIYCLLGDRRNRFVIALAGAFSIGILKELSDHQAQNFDIYANSLGLFIGILMLVILQNFTKLSRAQRP